MAVVSFADIRARFSTKIETLTGFTESRNPFDDFNRNPNTVAQKRFSVGIGEVEAIEEQRQSTSTGIICNTTVLVKFPFRLRQKDQIQDYDNSMTTAHQPTDIFRQHGKRCNRRRRIHHNHAHI